LKENPAQEITVDLPNQTVAIDGTDEVVKFDINNHKKTCLIQGFDDIDYLISQKDQVINYEQTRN
jgi:3-isopropylmalate/(R)-2-methylmalate dehydratase small subunit